MNKVMRSRFSCYAFHTLETGNQRNNNQCHLQSIFFNESLIILKFRHGFIVVEILQRTEIKHTKNNFCKYLIFFIIVDLYIYIVQVLL